MQSKRKNVDKRKIFLWCAAAGIVLCAVLFCLWHNRTALAEQRVERALSVTVSQPEPRLAQEDNTETGAWITVPGTNIDAPVQQASDNDYYLRRDTAGNADVHGCVFADYACDLNSTSLSATLCSTATPSRTAMRAGSRRCTITSRTALPKNILTFISRCPTLP